jgi:hypothetical protein
MTHEITMGPDGILRIELSGDLDNGIVENFRREVSPYVDASTSENPLYNLFLLKDLGRLSPEIRRYLIDLNQDTRIGFSAYVKPSRRAKILGQLILKATQRDNIQFFEEEADALEWLNQIKN